jgi:hypothetical protein
MAGLLHLRISGINEEQLRRWQIRSPEALAWGAGAKLIVLVLVLSYLPNLMQESSVPVRGQVVTGSTVLLIWDTSGSLDGQTDTIRERLASLRAAGIYSEVACRLSNSEFPDFVQCLDRVVREAKADGVYVLSDFSWIYDEARLIRMRQLFAGRPLRMYLETIGRAPHPELLRLAEESRGGLTGPGM